MQRTGNHIYGSIEPIKDDLETAPNVRRRNHKNWFKGGKARKKIGRSGAVGAKKFEGVGAVSENDENEGDRKKELKLLT